MGKWTILVLRVVIALALAGSLLVQFVMMPVIWADLDGAVLIKNDPFDGATIVDGRIALSDRPGIGVVKR